MNDNAALNLSWSAALATGLVEAGIRHVIVSPGSRSTPLTLACLRHPQLDCEFVLDERSAAWYALGMAKAGGGTVALLCTSGTAVANWLPATVEANQSGVPLLLLSADRPPELQGWGANQTIDQTHLLAPQLRAFHAPGAPCAGADLRWLRQLVVRATHESRWPRPGPVQINLAFREPLLPAAPEFVFDAATPRLPAVPIATPDAAALAALAERLQVPCGVIVCGELPAQLGANPAWAESIVALGERLACPILAEPLSGLRFGAHRKNGLCVRYDHWLRTEAWQAPERQPAWVLRFGAFPVTRVLQQYLAGAQHHFLVEAQPQWRDPLHRTDLLLQADPLAACRALLDTLPTPAGHQAWAAPFRVAEEAVASTLVGAELPTEARLVERLCASLPEATHFFCGNSMPIRDLDAFSGNGSRTLAFFANRGASGIDGNLATAAGLAASKPTLALVGDLTAQHDVGSLALMRDRPLVVVVINNGGGGIFDFLPQATLPEFERGWLTPQQFDLAAAANAFTVPYMRLTETEAVAAAALDALTAGRPLLIEVPVDRQQGLDQRRRWKESVARALSKAASACNP